MRQLRVVLELGGRVTGRIRLGDPQLHAVQVAVGQAGVLLGVRDAVTGTHEIQLPGPDDLL